MNTIAAAAAPGKHRPKKADRVRKQTVARGQRMGLRTCRECGCTDEDCSGCIRRTGKPCHWVELDLCSACVPKRGHERSTVKGLGPAVTVVKDLAELLDGRGFGRGGLIKSYGRQAEGKTIKSITLDADLSSWLDAAAAKAGTSASALVNQILKRKHATLVGSGVAK